MQAYSGGPAVAESRSDNPVAFNPVVSVEGMATDAGGAISVATAADVSTIRRANERIKAPQSRCVETRARRVSCQDGVHLCSRRRLRTSVCLETCGNRKAL